MFNQTHIQIILSKYNTTDERLKDGMKKGKERIHEDGEDSIVMMSTLDWMTPTILVVN